MNELLLTSKKFKQVSEWKEIELGNISTYVNRGFSPKYVDANGYIIINQKCIRGGKVDYSLSRLTNKEKKITTNKILQKGDILINSTGVGTAGRVGLFDENIVATSDAHISIVRIDREIANPTFIFYNLRGREAELEGIAEGSTGQIELGRERLKMVDILLPPIPQQRAIASVLSSLDDKIDLLHRQNKTLEQIAETLFRQWFVEDAKEDWLIGKIGDFVVTNEASIDRFYPHELINYLDTGSITEGKVESFQELRLSDAPSRAKRLVKHNDILISTVRPNQRHYGLIKNPIENLVVSTGFCIISCKTIDPHFIYVLLTTDEMTEYLHSIAEGSTSTYPSLKPIDLETIEFSIPPKERLDQFSEVASNSWNKIDSNQRQIQTLEKLRDTLLPKLMSGEVRVKIEHLEEIS